MSGLKGKFYKLNKELFNVLVTAIINTCNIKLAYGVTIISPTQELVTMISLKFGVDKLIITLIIAFLL